MFDLKGKVFNRLTVLERDLAYVGAGKEARWVCQCSCGKIASVRSYCLRKGNQQSCGCLRDEFIRLVNNTRHGMHDTETYHTWEGMKQRCLNPKATRYPDYGAVGITICDRWFDFTNFLEDMGERPKGKTLDRKNPYGNYEKDNCRWATPLEQQHNQRRHHAVPEEVATS